ncbi:MAG: YtxH domain-containing protein [Anaerolineae bacterium]|nr:YtxH domain-containing protein [Anaerolineae bacterium]
MDNQNYEHENDANQPGSFLAGLLVGGLAGAAAMLLLAPQSGKKTRAKIQQKSIKLREQTTEAVEDALKQAGVKAHQITGDVHEQAEALEQRGQDAIDAQRDHLGTTLKGLGKAVHT